MEMNTAKKVQYRHKLTGEDVRNWHPLTARGFWFPAAMLLLVTVVLLLADAVCQ
ncbi:hypothetical protein GCM10011328_05700 [Hafnia psychrotolerans]|uniref:Uncharacterized protein n=1 Tax=Hafnia psychrotolerans TaxID=1477018 RepID=A0ABQ1FZ90_9GAMM|nr:hypothetical protein GCM10011328_05700 [Hafnia psychrotolerans]